MRPIVTEAEERFYLEEVKAKIKAGIHQASTNVNDQFSNMLELKKHLSEHKADMDHIEKAGVRQTVDQLGLLGEHGALGVVRLNKLLKSPYFGRLDFQSGGAGTAAPVYIGIHSFYDSEGERHLVHDWRAPISSMFYDYEHGPASYQAPAGVEHGEIQRKRQYRIEHGELVFMLESSLNIHDGVLQEELSRASSDKMKNIVATIQRDQNAIIRNDVARVLVIQGAAGSGKTSIALHRIAFLLYRFKDTIAADDILIISPNKVFAHYISNVLPELGEENIRETTMEALASRLLGAEFEFETFYQQVAGLLQGPGKGYADRIRLKATTAFLAKLDEYIRHVKNTNFTAAPVQIARHTIAAEFIAERFHRSGNIPFAERINDILGVIIHELERRHGHEIKAKERESVRKQLRAMFASTSIESLYKGLYAWLGQPGMFKPAARGVYEYSDVYPLIYFRLQIEGLASFEHVKHLVVDEMQDYTPVQYTVISSLFPCPKTVLGDSHQSVNPLSSSTAEGIKAILPGAECVYMHRSYRSTIQISNFAQRINRNENLMPIERHGDEPELIACADQATELGHIRATVSQFLDSGYKSLGIVCKTQAAAALVHEAVQDLSDAIHLLDPVSTAFNDGVTIATAHLAKGLEFDQVLLPFCGAENYGSPIDRHMLYVGCTRAMHRLTLTYTGELTRFLRDVPAPAGRETAA